MCKQKTSTVLADEVKCLLMFTIPALHQRAVAVTLQRHLLKRVQTMY